MATKWARQYYEKHGRQYPEYINGMYVIRRTQDKNIFTGREMSSENQRWEIFKDGVCVDWQFTLREAKQAVERMEGGINE